MSAARATATAAAAAVEPRIDDAELVGWLERCLGSRVEALARRPLDESTSFACERLTLTAQGRTLELFFKDYGRCRLPRPDHDGARREVRAYRELLDGASLGTPTHLGSRLQPEDARSGLLLECVPGARLADRGWAHWLAAAAWLGRLQSHGVARGVTNRSPGGLARHDLAELRATAEDAVREVAAVDLRLGRALQDALDGHEGLVEVLAAQPLVLVHGSYRPENVLVDVPGEPGRVAPVDWEHVALGCALHDLAVLSAKLTRDQTGQLLEAQRAAAAERGLRLPEGDEAWELIRLLRLHKLLRSLGRCRRWQYERATIERLVALAARLRAELHESRGRTAVAWPHPALRCGRAAIGDEPPPRVERVRGRFFGRRGRVIYRLGGEGGRPAVIAKGSRHATLEVERHVYADLLPRLPVGSPRLLGFAEDGEWRWLFLEDVGVTRLDPDEPAQRATALRWLGALHAAAAGLSLERLPTLDARRHCERLAQSRDAVVAALEVPALGSAEPSLRATLAAIARVAAGWERVAAACEARPSTLVHGDFRPKNLPVRVGARGLDVLPIDWEYSGRGPPALDLGSLLRDGCTRGDLLAYAEGLGGDAHDLEPLREAVHVGRVLRALTAIHWASGSLSSPASERLVGNLALFAAALDAAFAELRP